MAYENGGCGPFEPAALGKAYRGLKLESNGTATDLTVLSAGASQPLHLEPGELVSGTLIIESGVLTNLKGYIS
jgi:hypothetical protein